MSAVRRVTHASNRIPKTERSYQNKFLVFKRCLVNSDSFPGKQNWYMVAKHSKHNLFLYLM